MKLMQLNVWGGRLEPQVLNLLRTINPDILCLQEAIDMKGGKGAMFVTVEEMQAAINAKYKFMSPVFRINFMNRKADFGNCIISKYPIKKTKTITTGEQFIENFDFLNNDPGPLRNLQLAEILLPDGYSINILNHHGHHIDHHKNGDAETMRQCRLITQQIKKLNEPIVLTGDFNLTPRSKSLEQINKVLTNLSIQAKLETTRTPLTHKTEVCDYIFVSNGIKVKSFKAIEDIASDHQALVLNFS